MPDSFQVLIASARQNLPLLALAVTLVASVAVANSQLDDHGDRIKVLETARFNDAVTLGRIEGKVDMLLKVER